MSFVLNYSCRCGFRSGILDEGQKHADRTGHTVDVNGTMSPRELTGVAHQLDLSTERKARELEILRQAKHRGLL